MEMRSCAAKKAFSTNTWSSSRRRPSGKRMACSSRNARRNSLCGLSRRISGGHAVVTPLRSCANSSRLTNLSWPTTLPTTTSAPSATARSYRRSSASGAR